MTTAVAARGSRWGWSEVFDSWGADTPDGLALALGELVLGRFHELTREAGDPSVYWTPELAEVTHEVYGFDNEDHSKWDSVYLLKGDLRNLRDQALEEVWEAYVEETGPMVAAVYNTCASYDGEE